MAIQGMDIEEVRQLAQQLEHSSGEIKNIVGQLTGKIDSAHWIGPDRENFHNAWQSHHVVALNNVSVALHDASMVANQNAQQQQDASTA